MSEIDLQQVYAAVLPLVVAAGERLCASEDIGATRKPDGSLVTTADIETDKLLSGQLRAAYPAFAVMSEEQQQVFDGSEWCWVLDPIDGTANFANGLPVWAVSLALLHNGSPVLGMLHFPTFRMTYGAVAGYGANCNGRRMDATRPIDRARLVSFCSRSYHLYYLQKPYKARMLGCSTYNLALVAAGAVDVGMDLDIRVWDVVVGSLLLHESGGYLRYLDGGDPFPLQAGRDYSDLSLSVISAASAAVADEILEQMVSRP